MTSRRDILKIGAGSVIGVFTTRILYDSRCESTQAESVTLSGAIKKIVEGPVYTSGDLGKFGIYPLLINSADGKKYLIPYLNPPFDVNKIHSELNDGDLVEVEIFGQGPYTGYPKSLPRKLLNLLPPKAVRS